MSAQIYEIIIRNGVKERMLGLPDLPTTSLLKKVKNFESKTDSIYSSTACWRRYQATWEVKDGKLYFIDIDGMYAYEGEPIFADWVSISLAIPQGKQILVRRYLAIYEREVHIKIEEGMVVSIETIDSYDNKLYRMYLQ